MKLKNKILIVLQSILAIGICIYWVFYGKEIQNDLNLYSYEASFPVPDIIFFGIIPIISNLLIILKNKIWKILTIMTASSLFYLGFVDMMHYIVVGIYDLSNIYILFAQFASFAGATILLTFALLKDD